MIDLVRSWPLTAALALAACGPGRLPDTGFGTVADDGESQTDGPDGPDGHEDLDSATSVGDDGPTSGPEGDGDTLSTSFDDDGSQTDGSSTIDDGSTGDGDGDGDGDGEGDGDGDGDPTDEGSFGIPPDVTNEPCEPLAQDCYPTHKCVPYATEIGSSFLDADKCMPILGDKAWGEPCTLSDFNEAQDDCDGDGFCWNIEWIGDELHGTCVPFCTGTPQDLMCPIGWGCTFTGAIALCDKQCHPFLQDCEAPYSCFWVGTGFDCLLQGSPGGDVEPCDEANDCQVGLGCVAQPEVPGCPGNAPSCCTPYCDTDAPDCPVGRVCVAVFEPDEAPPGQENIGLCLKP